MPRRNVEKNGIAGTKKGDRSRPFFTESQNLVLLFRLCSTQQVTQGGGYWSIRSNWLVAQALDGFFLVFNVFRLDRELDYAALAINADDLGFYFFAFFQNVTRIFNAVTADFGGFQSRFDIVGQGDDGAFGVNFFHDALNDCAFVVLLDVLGERIAFQLLDTQGDALGALGQPTG